MAQENNEIRVKRLSREISLICKNEPAEVVLGALGTFFLSNIYTSDLSKEDALLFLKLYTDNLFKALEKLHETPDEILEHGFVIDIKRPNS